MSQEFWTKLGTKLDEMTWKVTAMGFAMACMQAIRMPIENWPYGPPDHHQKCCSLFNFRPDCDCAASDASDT